MADRTKKKTASKDGFSLFDDVTPAKKDLPEDVLPSDEGGRAKIKKQYVALLGIRLSKLAGQALNRERINKNVEGVYFVCARCHEVCHNLDEGLIEEDRDNGSVCMGCYQAGLRPAKPVAKLAARPKPVRKKRPARPKAESSEEGDGTAQDSASKDSANKNASAAQDVEAEAPETGDDKATADKAATAKKKKSSSAKASIASKAKPARKASTKKSSATKTTKKKAAKKAATKKPVAKKTAAKKSPTKES